MSQFKNPDLALLLLRLGLAGIFLIHGLAKFTNLEGTIGFFGSLGLPAFVVYLVAGLEVLAGLAMLVGVGTEFAALAIVAVMLGAIALVKFKMGFSGGWEFELLVLLASLAVLMSGPGRYAIRSPRVS